MQESKNRSVHRAAQFFDEPEVYFMHIKGESTTEAMANGVKKALAASKEGVAGPQLQKTLTTQGIS